MPVPDQPVLSSESLSEERTRELGAGAVGENEGGIQKECCICFGGQGRLSIQVTIAWGDLWGSQSASLKESENIFHLLGGGGGVW